MGSQGFEKQDELMRVFFWAHHIRKKQVDMIELAEELSLTGLIVMGRPGYIFAEGGRNCMEEAIKRVKSKSKGANDVL